MPGPTPVVVITPATDLLVSDLGVTEVELDLTTSLPGDGASSIDTATWTLMDKPPGSTVVLDVTNPLKAKFIADKVGTYQWFPQVTNNLGQSSHASPRPIQAVVAPYGFTTPHPNALQAKVAVRLPNSNLPMPARGDRDWFEKFHWPWLRYVDQIGGFLGSAPVMRAIYEVYVSNDDNFANPEARGGMNDPFNPASAQVNGYGLNAVAQALAYLATLPAVTSESDDGLPTVHVLHLLHGAYDDDIVIETSAFFAVVFHGAAFGPNITIEHKPQVATGLAFFVVPAFRGSLLTCETIKLWNPDNVGLSHVFENVDVDNIIEGGSPVGSVRLECYKVVNDTELTHNTVRVSRAVESRFETLSVESIAFMRHCLVRAGITVQESAPEGSLRGFYDMSFDENVVFEGPADSAVFDLATVDAWDRANGTFVGDASELDWLPQSFVRALRGPRILLASATFAGPATMVVVETSTSEALPLRLPVRVGDYMRVTAFFALHVGVLGDKFNVGIQVSGDSLAPSLVLAQADTDYTFVDDTAQSRGTLTVEVHATDITSTGTIVYAWRVLDEASESKGIARWVGTIDLDPDIVAFVPVLVIPADGQFSNTGTFPSFVSFSAMHAQYVRGRMSS